jgi:hypothetical protein
MTHADRVQGSSVNNGYISIDIGNEHYIIPLNKEKVLVRIYQKNRSTLRPVMLYRREPFGKDTDFLESAIDVWDPNDGSLIESMEVNSST